MKSLLYITALASVVFSVSVARPSANVDYAPAADSVGTVAVSDTVDTLPAANEKATRYAERKRYVSPVNNAATRTQYVNDAQGDSARMLERRRQRSIHYHDENGNTIMVDTVTGQEWVDSTLIPPPPKMKQPLLFAVEAGVNIWDPVMRIFGQKYGGVDFSAALNLHNRYIPTFEFGIGMAHKTPSEMNFTYDSPVAPYFKIGADYNFIYNSDPDYRFVAGVRYGFSAFRYRITDVHFNDTYWGESGSIGFPTQSVTAGWFEIVLGLRVKIAGPISAGWMFRYHSLLHRTQPPTGDAWYIPGFGSANSSITGSFYIVYSFSLKRHNPAKIEDVHEH